MVVVVVGVLSVAGSEGELGLKRSYACVGASPCSSELGGATLLNLVLTCNLATKATT